MKIEVGFGDLRGVLGKVEGGIAAAATAAMRETTPDAKQALRDQVTGAGLGNRLANTWRGETYPKSRESVNPAGYIWSNAPDIVDSFVRGATIMPIAGSRFLAIPTENVPRARGRGARKRMTPAEVEHEFNQDLFYKRGRAGRVLAFISAVNGRRGRGIRSATSGRLAQGRVARPILMFVLVPSVRMPKLLDLKGPAEKWATSFEIAFARRLEDR